MKNSGNTIPTQRTPQIPFPKSWPCHVKSAVLHVISMVHFWITYARGWAANSINARVRTAAENNRLREEISLLREELRFKDSGVRRSLAHFS